MFHPLVFSRCIHSLHSGCEAMKMSAPTREKGVLKLVYPGHLVELHKNPITVAEVMRKNPRHCVTRPDVFRFPWIVVRPDSVLKPGRVFFVVPYHTLYRLLQSKGPQNCPPEHKECHLPHLEQASELDSCTELEPEQISFKSFFIRKSHVVSLNKPISKSQPCVVAYPSNDQSPYHKYPIGCSVKLLCFQKKPQKLKSEDFRAGSYPRQRKYRVQAVSNMRNLGMQKHDGALEKPFMKSHAKMKRQHDRDRPTKKRSPAEGWSTSINNHKHHQPQKPVNSLVEARPLYHTRQYAYDTHDSGLQYTTDVGSDLEYSILGTRLRPCLKKHGDNPSKSQGLSVSFASPLEGKRRILKPKPSKFH